MVETAQDITERSVLAPVGRMSERGLDPLETAAPVRTIPMPQVVVEALAAHPVEYEPGPDDVIFTNEAAQMVRRTGFGNRWRSAVLLAELPKGTRFHDLRHFYASLLIRHGESVKVVQQRLGSASATETLDTYSHLWPDSEDRTRAAVDAVLGSSRVTDVSRPAGA
jgi:integrase